MAVRKEAMKAGPPNILMIMVDQWRADCLGSAGHPVVQTPHLDEMAAQGLSFTRAYTALPSCVAARAAFLTGMHQKNHGFVGYNDFQPWNYSTTLPQTLAEAGYHTQCVGKMHASPARKLMGFHNVVLHDGYLHRDRRLGRESVFWDDYSHWLNERRGHADYIDSGLGCNGYVVHHWPYDEMEHPSAWTTTESIRFLYRRDPGKPFFLFTSYHRPHPPLDPPRSSWELYAGLELPEAPIGDWVEHPQQTRGALNSPVPLKKAERDAAKRAYYAQISFIDKQLNRLFMSLYEHNLRDNTIIIFTADHGDMLYDHRFIAKTLPFEGSSRIPLLFYFPPALQTQYGICAGQSVSEVAELRDIFATICDIAGIATPQTVDGQSMLPLCQTAKPKTAAFREYLHGEHSVGAWSNHWLCDGHEKYCWFSQSGRELLFDLDNDPQECQNLAPDRAQRLKFWREQLVYELSGREEGYVKNGALQVGAPPKAVLQNSVLFQTP